MDPMPPIISLSYPPTPTPFRQPPLQISEYTLLTDFIG